MSLININIKKYYNNFGLTCDFSISNGITGIFGPSGSGKSTLLNALAGFIKPDLGQISIQSQSFFDSNKKINIPPDKRNIGYVTQKANLFPSMSVDENINYGYKKQKNKIKLNSIVDIMNLNNLMDKFPGEISGGQSQKVAIARALASNPSVILMDEPLSELDLNSKLMILDYLKKIHIEYKIPIIYVSHDIAEMIAICDNVFLINRGSITKNILPTELIYENSNESDFQNIYSVVLDNEKNLKLNNQTIQINEPVENNHLTIMIPSSSVMVANIENNFLLSDNVFDGILKNIVEFDSHIKLVCDVGFEIIADISKEYYQKSNMKLNDKICVIFKSISVVISKS